MKNISKSDLLGRFDEKRTVFKPYGLTCELWEPNLMKRFDRHNDIELNYFPKGNMTYLFRGNKVTIPAQRLTLFWGLVPHQIIHYEDVLSYYVCTIPFSLFLSWNLPIQIIERLLNGEILIDPSDKYAVYDNFVFQNWIQDIHDKKMTTAMMLEMQSRVFRMSQQVSSSVKDIADPPIYANEVTLVEQIAIYIAKNYDKSIKVMDVGRAVGVHPDYASAIFKKMFGCSLSEYISEERIAHAQRKLISTNNSIIEIAFESGFNSISCFNNAFLKIAGCTPREYRKRENSLTPPILIV